MGGGGPGAPLFEGAVVLGGPAPGAPCDAGCAYAFVPATLDGGDE